MRRVRRARSFFTRRITLFGFRIIRVSFTNTRRVPTSFVRQIGLGTKLAKISPPRNRNFFKVFQLQVTHRRRRVQMLFHANGGNFLSISMSLTIFAHMDNDNAIIV